MSQKPSMPFVSQVGDAPPELMQQLVAALNQQPQRRPPGGGGGKGGGKGTRSPRGTGQASPATWKGGACFECGATGHTREDCPEFLRLSALPGGYPKDHENEYAKWKTSQGLPSPGYKGAKPRNRQQLPTKPAGALAPQTSADATQQQTSTDANIPPTPAVQHLQIDSQNMVLYFDCTKRRRQRRCMCAMC